MNSRALKRKAWPGSEGRFFVHVITMQAESGDQVREKVDIVGRNCSPHDYDPIDIFTHGGC
jgi:hypothetical protein